jgi:hypothetical protein
VELTYRASEIVRFREIGSDLRWIDVKHFDMTGSGSARELLAKVIANPWYDDDYASPSGALPVPSRGLHGPYVLDRVTVGSFTKVSTRACFEAIKAWATQLGPLPASFAATWEGLVNGLLSDSSAVYRLPSLGPSAEHQWGSHLGAMGFHEFVIVSSRTSSVALLVASDD